MLKIAKGPANKMPADVLDVNGDSAAIRCFACDGVFVVTQERGKNPALPLALIVAEPQ
jgi:hypothetical protein